MLQQDKRSPLNEIHPDLSGVFGSLASKLTCIREQSELNRALHTSKLSAKSPPASLNQPADYEKSLWGLHLAPAGGQRALQSAAR